MVAYLLRWCQRCPLAGCSYVSACEEGCMYHSSSHSLTDLWAACKSKMKSGWVLGAVRRKNNCLWITAAAVTCTHYFFRIFCLVESANVFSANSNIVFHFIDPMLLFVSLMATDTLHYPQIGTAPWVYDSLYFYPAFPFRNSERSILTSTLLFNWVFSSIHWAGKFNTTVELSHSETVTEYAHISMLCYAMLCYDMLQALN